MEAPQLNEHNKAEYPPMHSGEFDASPIMIYTSEDNTISLDVKLENETVWLSQAQMAMLFDTDRTSILRHINNIYKIGELDKDSTCAKIAQVRKEGKRTITRQIPLYNLDMIISVGYRVNSIRGTQFRIWANRILKDYIVKGYAINDKIRIERYNELKDVVRLLAHTVNSQEKLNDDQSTGLLSVVTVYVYALDTLDRYDYQQLTIENTTKEERFHATYENAMEAILSLKEKFGESRTEEKDIMVKVVVNLINQQNQ